MQIICAHGKNYKQLQRNTMKSRRNFTLIELLAVITIIAVIATMVVQFTSKPVDDVKKLKCLSAMKEISNACSAYEMTYGALPDSSSIHTLIGVLKAESEFLGKEADQNPKGREFLDSDHKGLDFWGKEYVMSGRGPFILKSAGPDGDLATEDDNLTIIFGK